MALCLRAAVCFWLTVAAFAVPARGQDLSPRQDRLVRRELDLGGYRVQQINPLSGKRIDLSIPIELDGVPVTLELTPSSVLAPGFQLFTSDGRGTLIPHPKPAENTYRGRIPQRPGALVSASIADGQVRALIFEDEKQWGLQPLTDVDPRADRTLHVTYGHDDVLLQDVSCGTNDLMQIGDVDAVLPKSAAGGTGCQNIAEIAFDADLDYYVLNGSDVGATMLDITGVVNAMNVIYERDALITHTITAIVVQTAEPDGYDVTDSSDLLNQFRAKWNNEHHSSAGPDRIDRDIAHLMTGKEIDGNVIGIAWLGVICASIDNGLGYGLSQSRFTSNMLFRVALTSHEVGHNWNASHCNGDADCGIMCSGIGGCAGILDFFGVAAQTSIANHRNSRSCLDSGSPPTFDCNVNCIEDALEISEGTSQDCNLNGIPDQCDISSGLSPDCDLNQIPDICESDCNLNGILDACELGASFSATSTNITPIGLSINPLEYTFTSLPPRLGDVTIIIEASADLAGASPTSKTIEVFLNGTSNKIGEVFNTAANPGTSCANPPDVDQFTITAAAFDALVGTGDATIELQAFNSDPFACFGDSYGIITLNYPSTDFNDMNGNGIPDICECDADCAAIGPDGLVTVIDLLDLLGNWGPGTTCDLAPPGGDGQITVIDLLELLGKWGSCFQP